MQKNVITVLVEHWYYIFFARKTAKSLSGQTDPFFSTTTFFLVKISINKLMNQKLIMLEISRHLW